jgi:hypothetical protein
MKIKYSISMPLDFLHLNLLKQLGSIFKYFDIMFIVEDPTVTEI